MAVFQFIKEQHIDADLQAVWDFISQPQNLKHITPPSMGFEITSSFLPKKMYAGMVISYKVSPLLGLKVNWVTEITQVKEGEFFIDEQKSGPYTYWHHQHFIKPTENGVCMQDVVTYIPPFGWFGHLINALVIKNKLNDIFKFRFSAMEKHFGMVSA